eukprot:scaffold17294_cov135-Isochrysis_galbana.AAC.1
MPPVVVSLPASGNVLVTAPTGVAALVVQGQTLHSNPGPGIPNGTTAAFGNMHSDSRRKVLAQMECLVIDEISMVRPALAPPRGDALPRDRRNFNGEPSFSSLLYFSFHDLLGGAAP